ncbi:hypothetical protein ACHAXN_013412 [Cyclotella atomus]
MAAATTKSPPGTTTTKHTRDAKSRYNIGVVYLKTGDFTKATENLSHSLYCHLQLHGSESVTYSPEASIAIAGVREKLGDCYASNPEWGDKSLALDHYVEVRRLLQSLNKVEGEAEQMLERVEEKINDPELLMADSGKGSRERGVPMPEVPAAYLRAQTPKKRREVRTEGGNKDRGTREAKDRGTREAKDSVGKRRPAKGKKDPPGDAADLVPAHLVRNGTKNIQNIGRGFIDSLGGMIEDVDDLLQKRSKGVQIFRPKSSYSGEDYVRSDTGVTDTELESDSEHSNPAYVDDTHKDAAAAKKIKQFTRAARRNMQKISTARPMSRGRSAQAEDARQERAQSPFCGDGSIASDNEEASPEHHSTPSTFKYRIKSEKEEPSKSKHSSRISRRSTMDSEYERANPEKHSSHISRRSTMDSKYEESSVERRSKKKSSRRSSIDSEYSESRQERKPRSGMGSQLGGRDGLKQAIALSQYEEGGSVSSRRSTTEIIRDYQETVGKMRAQLNEERRGFAIMSCKFVEEKNKMSAEVQDLSWKVALRGQRINRLEKEINKLTQQKPVEAVVQIDHLHWESMDLGEFFLHVESKFFKLEKELEGCKWVIESLTKMDPRSASLAFRLDLLLEGLGEMASIAEVLIEGLESWLSSHAEAATKNEELFFHVENKFLKLQNELKLCKGIVESLAKSIPGPTNLPARLNMLLDGLNEVASIKNQLFKSSTVETKKSRSSVTTTSQTEGRITEETSPNESSRSEDISPKEVVLKQSSSKQFTRAPSRDKFHKSPGSETTETTATISLSVDTFASVSPNEAKDFQAMAARVSSQNRKPKRSQQRHKGRPRGGLSQ